jgi:competence protein ComEC
MLIDYGEVEILLTGDIESPAENRLLSENRVQDIDILKVAHHGSRTSTTEAFLAAFQPEVAMISAGRTNPFGHPAPEIVERLQHRGIAVARTDVHGTLRVRTDGRRIQISHYGSPGGESGSP